MSMHNTDPSPSKIEPKHPSRYTEKSTVRRTSQVVPIQLSVLEAFFSELPMSNVVQYIRSVDVTPLITDLAVAPYQKEKVLDFIPTGTALVLTSIEQILYNIRGPSPDRLSPYKIPKNSGEGLENPILFNLKANGVPVFDWSYRDTTGSIIEDSGTTIADENILFYGKHDTAVCILENTDLSAFFTLFGNTVGTNTAEFATVRLRGFQLPTKALQTARLKFGF